MSPAEAPRATGRGEPETVKLSLMRRAIVRSSVAGAAVPVFYLRTTADVTDLLAARAALRADATEPVATVNDAVVHAVAAALRAHPRVNSSYADNALDVHPRVNVGVAVAVDDGLVVPAVYDADTLTVAEIGAAVRELGARARARKLDRDVLADSTFTVSNLGMFGVREFAAIINPGEAAILAVGAVEKRPVVQDGELRVGDQLTATLSGDHRVIDGAIGAQFLRELKQVLEAPLRLLL